MKDALKDTFYFSNNHKGAMITILLPYLVIMLVIDGVARLISEQSPSLLWLELVAMLLIQPLYIGRLIKYMNNTVNKAGEDISISLQEWWNLFIVYLLYSLALVFGLMLFIIPGLYFAMRLGFAEFDTLLNGRSPMASLKQSWSDTKPYFWQLTGGTLILGSCSLALTILVSVAANSGGDMLVDALSLIVSTVFMVFVTVFFFRVFDGMPEKSHTEPSSPVS